MSQAVFATESRVRGGTLTRPGGRTLRYAEYGAPEGRPVLFLHGTPGSRLLGDLFDDRARSEEIRLLAPDRPGFGDSTPAPDRTPTDTAADLRAVLDDADVDSADLIGFSGGACYALALAATAPDRVGIVDLVAGAVPPDLRSETPAVQRLLGALASRTPRLLGGLLRFQRFAAARGSPDVVVGQYTTGDADVPAAVADLVRRDFLEALSDSRSGTVVESRHAAAPWPFSLDVECPVRLWHGARDGNVPVSGARRLADRLPDADLTVFEDADHLGALLRFRADAFAAGT